MTNEDDNYHEFLKKATYAVADIWEKAYGTKLNPDDIYAINVALGDFFEQSGNRPGWQRQILK